jgi:hypothetical protein
VGARGGGEAADGSVSLSEEHCDSLTRVQDSGRSRRILILESGKVSCVYKYEAMLDHAITLTTQKALRLLWASGRPSQDQLPQTGTRHGG